MTTPKVIVCQHGARRRYVVARLLEEVGMLAALYTDSCEYSLLGRIAKRAGPLAGGSLLRLIKRRRIEGVPKSKVFCSDIIALYSILNSIKRNDPEVKWQQLLARRMIKWNKCENKIIYNMYCENLLFLRYARNHKAKIIVDVYINPLSNQIIDDEYRRLGLTKALPHGIDAVSLPKVKEAFDLADILICPSAWVAAGVEQVSPENTHKIRISPYGSNIDHLGQMNTPIRGRMFWAGGSWIRKGLHYLATAADELKKKYPDMDFRIAGITDPAIQKMSRFRNMTFVGQLDEEQMKDEFLSADAFVFPTLSEGMAGVVLEAIAAGCPIITTRAAGIDAIKNGLNGVIVPERNAEELRAAMEKVYCNREYRDRLAANTMTLAPHYTTDARKERLINIMREL